MVLVERSELFSRPPSADIFSSRSTLTLKSMPTTAPVSHQNPALLSSLAPRRLDLASLTPKGTHDCILFHRRTPSGLLIRIVIMLLIGLVRLVFRLGSGALVTSTSLHGVPVCWCLNCFCDNVMVFCFCTPYLKSFPVLCGLI